MTLSRKKSNISIETCFRWLDYGIERTSFLTFQIPVKKMNIDFQSNGVSLAMTGEVFFNGQKIWQQVIYVYPDKIIFDNSHEDPLFEYGDFTYINLHLYKEVFKDFQTTGDNQLELKLKQKDKVLFEEGLSNIPFDKYFHENHSFILGTTVTSKKDCILTLHLGTPDNHYHEQRFELKSNEIFDFSSYIEPYSYIGVQCSYVNTWPEIEEKHILKGQKGIYETCILNDGKNQHYSSLPFSPTYLNTKYPKDGFIEVKNIDEIVSYHQHHPVKKFTMDKEFLIPHYKKTSTYSQSGLYCNQKKNNSKIHIQNSVCENCPFQSECLQTVPSTLSHQLWRENLALENFKECRIFKIIGHQVTKTIT